MAVSKEDILETIAGMTGIDRFGAIGTVSRHTVTFGANFRLTDQSFPPVFGQDPVAPPTYMGDYDQATADNDFFYTTWGDNRLANPNYPAHAHQPDVRLAKILITSSGGGSALVAANMPTTIAPRARSQSLGQHNVQPLLTVALAYWANTGIDVSSLQGINVRITNLGGRTLGLANGDTIWLDDDAAGRGWFVDPTPCEGESVNRVLALISLKFSRTLRTALVLLAFMLLSHGTQATAAETPRYSTKDFKKRFLKFCDLATSELNKPITQFLNRTNADPATHHMPFFEDAHAARAFGRL